MFQKIKIRFKWTLDIICTWPIFTVSTKSDHIVCHKAHLYTFKGETAFSKSSDHGTDLKFNNSKIILSDTLKPQENISCTLLEQSVHPKQKFLGVTINKIISYQNLMLAKRFHICKWLWVFGCYFLCFQIQQRENQAQLKHTV